MDILEKINGLLYEEEVSSLFDSETADGVVDKLKAELKVPFAKVYKSELGGKENVSILMKISLDPKEKWENGIIQNSRYGDFHLNRNGNLEMFSGELNRIKMFRRRKVKSVDEVIRVLNTYFDSVEGNNDYKK